MRRPLKLLALAVTAITVSGQAMAQEFKLGGITVVTPWARATPGGAKVAGAYLEIRAAAGVEDNLIAAKSPVAGSVELHDHVDDGGVMKMRKQETIPIKGAQSVVLKPGGLHIMLMELKAPLKEGDKVQFTLVFEKAGELTIEAPISKVGASGPDAAGGSGSGASMGSGSGSGSGR